MYAIIATGGKQYKVSEGDVIRVEKLNVEEGNSVTFDQVEQGWVVMGKSAGQRLKLSCREHAVVSGT